MKIEAVLVAAVAAAVLLLLHARASGWVGCSLVVLAALYALTRRIRCVPLAIDTVGMADFTLPAARRAYEEKLSDELGWDRASVLPQPLQPAAAALLDDVVGLIVRDFVSAWFSRVSDTPYFGRVVQRSLTMVAHNVILRTQDIPWSDFWVLKIIPRITRHLHAIDKADAALKGSSLTGSAELDSVIARLYQQGDIHPGASALIGGSDGKIRQQDVLRLRVQALMPHMLPPNEAGAPIVRTLLTEVVTCSILGPLLAVLADPDTWNLLIIQVASNLLRERRQLKRLREVLQSHVRKSEQSSRRNVVRKILPNDTEHVFNLYMETIRSCRSLSEARRLRSEINVQLAQLERYDATLSTPSLIVYRDRVLRAKRKVDKVIARLVGSDQHQMGSTESTNLRSPKGTEFGGELLQKSLSDILNNPSDISYFMEFMERADRMKLLQFWLVVEGLREPLEEYETDRDEAALIDTPTIPAAFDDRKDIQAIRDTYFQDEILCIPSETKQLVQRYLELDIYDRGIHLQARRSVFAAQSVVFHIMSTTDYKEFCNSKIYFRLLSLWRAAENDKKTSGFDDTNANYSSQSLYQESVPDPKVAGIVDEGLVNDALNTFLHADLNDGTAAAATKSAAPSSPSPSSESPGPSTFLDDSSYDPLALSLPDLRDDEKPDEAKHKELTTALPGDLVLSETVVDLNGEIENLIQQEIVAEGLLRKAELTNNTRDISLLTKSLDAIREDKALRQNQRDYFEMQERENDLYGRSRVSLTTTVDHEDDGTEFVLYIIEVKRLTDEGAISAEWIVAHRYREFFILHKALKAKYERVSRMVLPPKRVIMKMQRSFIETRRNDLENYLQELLQDRDVCRSRELRYFLSQRSTLSEDMLKTSSSVSENPSISKASLAKFSNLLKQASLGRLRRYSQTPKAPSATAAQPPAIDMIEQEPDTLYVRRIVEFFMEIFDFDKSYTWISPKIMMSFLQQLFGGTIEKRTREMMADLGSPEHMIEFISKLKEIVWPGGVLLKMRPVRSVRERNEAYLEANILLAAVFPSYLPQNVSDKMFRFIQNPILNTHIILTLMDCILQQLFPELQQEKL